jgi:ABC-type antimicrobial peptide transport system permease subunit
LEKPVGEFLTWSPEWRERGTYKILGVVRDMVKGSPFEPTDPSIIFLSEGDMGNLYIRLNPQVSPHVAIPKIEKVFNSLVPSAPFDYKFADEVYEAKFRAEARVGTLATIFSVLAILISCSGLFGLASFVAEQRTKEVGIRKVLGASIINLWGLLSKEFVLLVIISCLVAIPFSYSFMIKWLEQYEYKTTVQWYVFAAAGAGALAITLLTVSFQAVKAAMANPVNSLKTE